MAVTTIPKELREKLGEAGADALAALVNAAIEDGKNGILEIVEERFARRLAEESSKLRADMHEALASQRVELLTRMANLEVKVREEISKLRDEITNVRAELTNVRYDVRAEFTNVRSDVRAEFTNVRFDARADSTTLRAEFKTAVAELKASMVRWMFLFWITQMAAFLAILWKFIT